MAISTLTIKGQITIPQKIRKLLELKAHDKINFVTRGQNVLIRPVKGNLFDIRGSVKPKTKHENFEEIIKITKKAISKKAVEK